MWLCFLFLSFLSLVRFRRLGVVLPPCSAFSISSHIMQRLSSWVSMCPRCSLGSPQQTHTLLPTIFPFFYLSFHIIHSIRIIKYTLFWHWHQYPQSYKFKTSTVYLYTYTSQSLFFYLYNIPTSLQSTWLHIPIKDDKEADRKKIVAIM